VCAFRGVSIIHWAKVWCQTNKD